MRLLKPIVRVCVKYGITEETFSQIVRETFVEVVYEDFKIKDKEVSVARVAVLTAMSRKAVIQVNKRIANDPTSDIQASNNLAFKACQGWLTDPEFLTTKNKPRILHRLGDSPSFPALVEKHCGDITQGAIRNELLRIGAIERVGDTKLRLLISEVPQPTAKVIAKLDTTANRLSQEATRALHSL